MATTSAYSIGTLPLVGEVPGRMVAQVVRQDRLGDPINAFEIEEIYTPSIKPDEVLVAVMAAGINYNNVWAARGIPIDIIATSSEGRVGGGLPCRRQRRVGDRVCRGGGRRECAGRR